MLNWIKSSFSNGSGGNNCVEVRRALGNNPSVIVRNSNKPNGHRVRFTRDEWDAFINGVKTGEFDYDKL